jgi:lipopolysaccharide/colanic/teichoic acid biosynthesis glycosyltransferase
MMYEKFGKRLLDVVLAGLATIVLSPVLILTGLAIRLEDGSPVIYRQSRIGQEGRAFTMFKFRSMPRGTEVAPSAGMRTTQVTRVGKVIRRLNVDELPQLFNILRGDMTVVGPRPALSSQVTLIANRAAGPAHGVRPGLTGLAQVKAYDGMSEEAKAELDNQYAGRLSLHNDVQIIASTAVYLFQPPPTY